MEISSSEIEIDLKIDFLKGDKGDKGEMGLSNNIKIGVVESGEEASAEIVGEVPNQVLNLVLPKGDKGDKGDVGDLGPPNVLSIGTIETGEEAGAKITGEAPNQVLNLVLPKGDKGDKGDIGETGSQGFAPSITEKVNTDSEYVLTITNEFGSFDTPNLRDPEQFNNFLSKNNAVEYEPTDDYNPATKLYVDSSILAVVGNIGTILDSINGEVI